MPAPVARARAGSSDPAVDGKQPPTCRHAPRCRRPPRCPAGLTVGAFVAENHRRCCPTTARRSPAGRASTWRARLDTLLAGSAVTRRAGVDNGPIGAPGANRPPVRPCVLVPHWSAHVPRRFRPTCEAGRILAIMRALFLIAQMVSAGLLIQVPSPGREPDRRPRTRAAFCCPHAPCRLFVIKSNRDCPHRTRRRRAK